MITYKQTKDRKNILLITSCKNRLPKIFAMLHKQLFNDNI